MKKYVMDMFFEDNPKAGRNWLKQYAVNAIENMPEGTLKEKIKDLYDKNEEKVDNLELWYSNDFYVHLIMSQFIDTTDEITSNELKNVFVGKKIGDEANATAHFIDPDFTGYLITFNFELEYQLFNVSEVFASDILLCTTQNEDIKNWAHFFHFTNVEALPNQNEVGLIAESILPEQVHKKYLDLSRYAFLGATAFVLAHEIGHHFLNHTTQQNSSILPFISNNIRGGNINHEYEFAADEYALKLMLEGNKEKSYKFEYLSGPFIVMVTLAFEDSSPDKSSSSHPSIKDRYLNIKEKTKNYCSEEEYETLIVFTERILQFISDVKNPWDNNIWWK